MDSYSSSGATSITGGNITFSVPVSTQTLNVSGGTANFNEQVDPTTALDLLSGGTLGGSGNVTVPAGGNASWNWRDHDGHRQDPDLRWGEAYDLWTI